MVTVLGSIAAPEKLPTKSITPMTVRSETSIYSNGLYLAMTGGTWHVQDSPFKASWINRMLARHPELRPNTICEIGCGAGAILSELQKTLPKATFTGYEISPQANAISTRYANETCRYVLGDAFADSALYDLVLVMDVVEHVEDCFSFMRQSKHKGRLKLYHIPLDASAQRILRGVNEWDTCGHIHIFTIETAIKSLEYTGHRIIDWILSDGALSRPGSFLCQLGNALRRPLAKLSPKLAVRLFGGYSILILAE
jgi:protein-L-isoaspartate O-methyltransferase